MIELLDWIFSSPWKFVGTWILIVTIMNGINVFIHGWDKEDDSEKEEGIDLEE